MLKHLRTHMRWIMIAIVLAFLLSTFLMYDSGRSRGVAPSTTADGRLEDYIVASINGRDVMRSELETLVRNYVQQSNIRDLVSTDIPFLYQAAFDNAVFQTELNKEVDARDIEITDDEITAQINVMADQFPTRETFYQSIERSGVNMDDLRNDIKRQIAMERTVAASITPEVISDDAVFEFYDMMKGFLYSRPKGFMFDIVSLSDDKTAGDIRAKIAEDSSKWQEVISADPRSSDVTRQSPSLFFSEVALSDDRNLFHLISLDIGEVGNVISLTSNDYMIAIKRESREASVAPYDEVSLDVRTILEEQQQRVALDNFRNDMMGRAVVEIYDRSIFPAPVSDDFSVISSPDISPASDDAASESASVISANTVSEDEIIHEPVPMPVDEEESVVTSPDAAPQESPAPERETTESVSADLPETATAELAVPAMPTTPQSGDAAVPDAVAASGDQ